MSRYDVPAGDSEFEAGSDGQVLRNFLGIVDPREMELLETEAYLRMVKASLDSFDDHQVFTSADLNVLHGQWLGEIYPFAGSYRAVNVSKSDFMFCVVEYIPQQMEELDRLIKGNMPCRGKSTSGLAKSLAEVHGEFILIHPYREGNGRLGRWLASLMALQAGHPILDFTAEMSSKGRDLYFRAIRNFPSNPSALENWFLGVLERGSAASSPPN